MNINNIPKIVLHLHLDGSLDLNLAYKWYLLDGYSKTFLEFKELMQLKKNCKDLNEYLKMFTLPVKLLNSKDRIEEATYQLFSNLSKENVIYAEVRFAPFKHVNKFLSADLVIEAAINGMNRSKKDFNIDGSLILCCMRDDNKKNNLEVVNLAKKYLNKGVGGIDLAGAESLFDTSNYQYIFELAEKLNIPYTIHAGEASGPNSINKAIDFKTKRIGHGIRSIEDINTCQRIIDNNILLEVCVTSNYQTEVVKEIHPIYDLYKKNIKISINTDNDTVSNINITNEYYRILKETKMTINDIIMCNIISIDYIFQNDDKKKIIKKRYLDMINQLKNNE